MLLSGGLDSAALLYWRTRQETLAVFVDYGQISAPGEEKAARAVAAATAVPIEIVRATGVATHGAGILGGLKASAVPDGETELQQQEWFPARNLFLGAVAAVVAGREGAATICFGASAGDYRDGRAPFYRALGLAIQESLPPGSDITVEAPLVDRLHELSAAVDLGLEPRLTFSCNVRGDRHCWRCASCHDRRELLSALDAT